MAEFPALPLWTDAYLADCSHLTDAEHGRYLQLLMLMWRTPACRVPNENKWLARRLRRSVDDVHEEIRPLIEEFCDCDGNWITQKRLQKEWKFVQKRSRKNRASAKARWNNEKSDANGDANNDAQTVPEAESVASITHRPGNAPTPTPTSTPKVREEEAAAANTGTTAARDSDNPNEHAAARPSKLRPVEPEPQCGPTAPSGDAPAGDETHQNVPNSRAVDIIAAFDAERARVFGDTHARPHPNATDLGVAKAMLEGGADIETCRFVFRATLERQKAAGQRPAAMLRYMRDPVADAVAEDTADPLAIAEKYRRASPGTHFRNPTDVQRTARVESYRRAIAEGREPFWLDEWGAPPDGGTGS